MTTLREHLQNRQVDLNLHTVWVDEEEQVASFPLWNLTGQLVGYQAYRSNASKVRKNDEKGKYYTYRGERLLTKHHKTVAIWGMETWYNSNVLFVCEGLFDAAVLTKRGYAAVGVLSNDPSKSVLRYLWTVRQTRPVVSVCDPGKAGAKLRKCGHVYWDVNVEGDPDADLNDAPPEYVDYMLSTLKF